MKILKSLRSGLAYTAAVLSIFVLLIGVLGMDGFGRGLARGANLRISPKYTGGELRRGIDHGAWSTGIHEPVFESLFGKSRGGFVQIDWSPKQAVPEEIGEAIDYDGDGRTDFDLVWRRGEAAPTLRAYSAEVGSVLEYYELANRFAVRIELRSSK